MFAAGFGLNSMVWGMCEFICSMERKWIAQPPLQYHFLRQECRELIFVRAAAALAVVLSSSLPSS